MGYYVLIHTLSDPSEGCEVAGQEMSRNMEGTEKQGILEHMLICWSPWAYMPLSHCMFRAKVTLDVQIAQLRQH